MKTCSCALRDSGGTEAELFCPLSAFCRLTAQVKTDNGKSILLYGETKPSALEREQSWGQNQAVKWDVE